jgi:type IV secretion system protein TrbL
LLVTIDFAWAAIMLAIKASELEDFTSTIIKKLFFYGFGVLLIIQGPRFAILAGESFIQLAGITVNGEISSNPAKAIWDKALTALSTMYDGAKEISILRRGLLVFFVGIAMIVLIALCAFMCLTIIVTYCEFVIVVTLATFALALNATSWTTEYGKKYLHYTLLAGVKLFATVVMAYFGIALIDGWIIKLKYANPAPIFYGLAGLFIFAYLLKSLPDRVVGALSDGGLSNDGLNIGSQAVKLAAVGTMAAATGGASALGAATTLAKAQGATGVMGVAGGAAKNLGKAFAEDMKGSFSASNRAIENSRAGGGHIGDRMAANMDNETRGLKDSDGSNEGGNETRGLKYSGGSNKGGNSISAGEGNAPSTGSVDSQSDSRGGSGDASGGSSSREDSKPATAEDVRAAAFAADAASAGGAFSRSTGDSVGSFQGGASGQGSTAAPAPPQVSNSGSGTGSGRSAEIASDFTSPSGSTLKADSGNSMGTTAFDPTGDNMATTQGDSAGQISNATGSAAPTVPQIKNSGGGPGAPARPAGNFTPPVGTSVSANPTNATADNMQVSDRFAKIQKEMESFRRKSI